MADAIVYIEDPNGSACPQKVSLLELLASCGFFPGGTGGGGFTAEEIKAIAQGCVDAHLTSDPHGSASDTFVTFATNPDGSVTFVSADGGTTVTLSSGGGGTVDTDTNVSWVTNPDGSITITSPLSGNSITIDQSPDTDTNISFVANPDGSWTFTSTLTGETMTIPPHTIDTDTVLAMTSLGDGLFQFVDPNTGQTIVVGRTDAQIKEVLCSMMDDAEPLPDGFTGPAYVIVPDDNVPNCKMYQIGFGPCGSTTPTGLIKVSHSPINGTSFDASNIPQPQITFNKQIESVGCLYIVPAGTTTPVPGPWVESVSGGNYTYTFTGTLAAGTYTYGIADCIADADGNTFPALEGPCAQFEVTGGSSGTAPVKTNVDPADGDLNVPANYTPSITFDKPIDPTSAQNCLVLRQAGSTTNIPVNITGTNGNQTWQVDPISNLTSGVSYRVIALSCLTAADGGVIAGQDTCTTFRIS